MISWVTFINIETFSIRLDIIPSRLVSWWVGYLNQKKKEEEEEKSKTPLEPKREKNELPRWLPPSCISQCKTRTQDISKPGVNRTPGAHSQQTLFTIRPAHYLTTFRLITSSFFSSILSPRLLIIVFFTVSGKTGDTCSGGNRKLGEFMARPLPQPPLGSKTIS